MKHSLSLPISVLSSLRKRGFFLLLLLFWILPVKAQVVIDTAGTGENEETVIEEDNEQQEEGNTSPFLTLGSSDSLQLHKRMLGETARKRYTQDPDFWYADARLDKKKKTEIPPASVPYTPIIKRDWFKTLLWMVIIISFAAVLLYYLSDSHLGLFRRRRKIRQEETGAEAEMPEDIFSISYDREIQKAISAGNYRLAVRLHYLRLLSRLAEKNIIRYQPDKTNFDYILQVQQTPLYADFFRVTRYYEYSWYGQFDVREDVFGLIRNDIVQLEEKAGS